MDIEYYHQKRSAVPYVIFGSIFFVLVLLFIFFIAPKYANNSSGSVRVFDSKVYYYNWRTKSWEPAKVEAASSTNQIK